MSDFRIDLRVRFAETTRWESPTTPRTCPTSRRHAWSTCARSVTLSRSARQRRPRVRGRRDRRALSRAAAVRRRVHGHLRAREARPGDVHARLPGRARRRARPRRSTRHAVLDRETGAPRRLPAWLSAMPVEDGQPDQPYQLWPPSMETSSSPSGRRRTRCDRCVDPRPRWWRAGPRVPGRAVVVRPRQLGQCGDDVLPAGGRGGDRLRVRRDGQSGQLTPPSTDRHSPARPAAA